MVPLSAPADSSTAALAAEKAAVEDLLHQVNMRHSWDFLQACRIHKPGTMSNTPCLSIPSQAQEELLAFEVQRQQLAAAESLAGVVLCRRMLLRWRQTAWELRAWREEKRRMAALGRTALARWALRRLHCAARQQRGLAALRLRSDLGAKRRALHCWRALAIERRCGGVYGAPPHETACIVCYFVQRCLLR